MHQDGYGSLGCIEPKQGKTGTGGRKLCERQEDHSGMERDISETGNIGTKGETRGTGTNRGVSEM